MGIWLIIIIGILGGLVAGALSTLRINCKAEEEVSRKMATVFSKVLMGLRKEIYLRKYGLSQIECDECHLPGDCPLCGAK